MRVFIFGDANIDVTVRLQDVKANLNRLSPRNKRLISRHILNSNKTKRDLEYYLPGRDEELSEFFGSLRPRVEFGGCGAIKAHTMALLGHDVIFYSWIGDDERGRMILDELDKAGVDAHLLVSGRTCETYNVFDPQEARLAFSFWENKLDISKFKKAIKKEKPDAVFLTGAHRIRKSLGYASVPDAYVFTGSFAAYTPTELRAKYKGDFSSGVLVTNDLETLQLARALYSRGIRDPTDAMRILPNETIIMHGPDKTAVKRGRKLICCTTPPLDRSKAIELTGIGDVWESFFLAGVRDIKTASKKAIITAMEWATKASMHRMLTGEFPKKNFLTSSRL